MTRKDYQDVLEFWFMEEHIPLHFAENEEFDLKIREAFLETWQRAKEGLLVNWRQTPKGRLAEIIVLDQFSRNLFRNDIRTYTQDKMAIVLAQELVISSVYEKLSINEKKFALLPFMHSESTDLHDWAYPYYKSLGDENTLWFEDRHREVLDRFGRYPYQNDDLGRQSTKEEINWLKENKGHVYLRN